MLCSRSFKQQGTTELKMSANLHKYVFKLCLFVTCAVIADKYCFFFVGREIFEMPILIAEWTLLILLLSVLARTRGYIIVKIAMVVFTIKILYYVVYLAEFNFQKNILILILLSIYIFEEERFRIYSIEMLHRHYTKLLLFLLLSFLPFAWFYNRYFQEVGATDYSEILRLSGLWELPHTFAYLVLGMMLLNPKDNVILNVFLYINIMLTGVRSAMIAGAIYFVYSLFYSLINIKRVRTQLMVFGTLIVAGLSFGHFTGLLAQLFEFHITPLLKEDLSDPLYGKGRIVFNLLAVQDIKHFAVSDLMIGKSATQLYDLFIDYLGIKSWPHNDFITVLYVFGVVGLALYCYALFYLPWRNVRFSIATKIPVISLMIFILALTNGFYTYYAIYIILIASGIAYQHWLRGLPDHGIS